MPNYRLTHKMTGVTVPATAGYYGADEQSDTRWKKAGAEMYQWKSDDFANAYFMGATVDLDAFKTVTIGDTTSAFDGAYTYSATVSRWLKSTTHWIFKDGTTWKMTDGVTTYTAPDNGLNTPPSSFTRELEYPLEITVVDNGTPYLMQYYTVLFGKRSWILAGQGSIFWTGTKWRASLSEFCDHPTSTDALPPKSGYGIGNLGGNPPTLEYELGALTATLSVTSSAKFAASSLSGTWQGVNGGTGVPAYSEYTLGESWSSAEGFVFFSLTGFIESATSVNVGSWNFAEQNVFESIINYIETATSVNVGGWNMAEQTIFDSLKNHIGNTENTDCFRGYLPVNSDGKPKFSNVWMMTSGGTSRSFPIERTYGASGAWCNMLKPVDIMGLFENREIAMHFSGAVEAWLKETNNVHQVGNVTWCHLVGLAEPPEELIIEGKRYWRIKIPLEMLYLTEGVHA